MKNSRHSLVKLPPTTDLALYLIREELKSQKFFHALSKAGIDDVYYKPYLGKAILVSLGLDIEKDETFQFFYKLVEKRSKKIEMDNESIMKQVLKVYTELINYREQMKGD